MDEDIFNAALSLNMHGYFFSNLNVLSKLNKIGEVSSIVDSEILSQVEVGKNF